MTLQQPIRPPPLAFYERPAPVTQQLCEMLARTPAEWPARAGVAGAGRLRTETLVHLARQAEGRDERTIFGKLMLQIAQRTAAGVKRHARGFDETTTERIALEVDLEITVLIMETAPTRPGEFLEVSFETALRNRTIDAVRRVQRQIYTTALAADDEDDTCRHEPASEEPDPEAWLLARERGAMARALLRTIRNPLHRDAYKLHHFLNWPIESADPTVATLSTHFNRTPRQIRNWLAKAEADMRAAANGDNA